MYYVCLAGDGQFKRGHDPYTRDSGALPHTGKASRAGQTVLTALMHRTQSNIIRQCCFQHFNGNVMVNKPFHNMGKH